MIHPVLLRCEYCLSLSVHKGSCTQIDCQTISPQKVEEKARFLLQLRGYRIFDGHLWFVTFEEEDRGWDGNKIAQFDGTFTEAFRLLMAHRWPITDNIGCTQCHDAHVELGGMCDRCRDEAFRWAEAERD